MNHLEALSGVVARVDGRMDLGGDSVMNSL